MRESSPAKQLRQTGGRWSFDKGLKIFSFALRGDSTRDEGKGTRAAEDRDCVRRAHVSKDGHVTGFLNYSEEEELAVSRTRRVSSVLGKRLYGGRAQVG